MSTTRPRSSLTVHRATTEAERQAIYRFRYEVYYEEYGRLLGGPDHCKRQVTDADDLLDTTTLLYTGTPERITGTVRLRHWAGGQVPKYDIDELSIDRFEDYESLNTAEIGRLMVRPSLRGKLILAALLRASYTLLVEEHQTDLTFCYCSPVLVRYYQHLAMRPFGGRPVAAPDGVMLPMVSVMTDVDFYRASGSFLAPLAETYVASPQARPFDQDRYGGLFEGPECGLAWRGPDVVAEVVRRWRRRQAPTSAQSTPSPLVDAPGSACRELLAQGLVFDVPGGLMVTRRGFCEQELYVVLEGSFEVEAPGQGSIQVGPWQTFGEEALFDALGRRRRTVHAVSPGRLWVLPAKALERWLRSHPQVAAAACQLMGQEFPNLRGVLQKVVANQAMAGTSAA